MSDLGKPVTPPRPLTPGPAVGSLLDRLKARDAAAWQDFVQVFGPVVYEWCRQIGLSASSAAQISEHVLRDATVEIASTFSPGSGSGLRSWLWTKTRTILESRNGTLEPPPHDPPTDGSGVLQRLLPTLRLGFEDRSWQAFWRVVIDGKTPAEVATELGISTDAVRVAKARILRRVREELAMWTGQSYESFPAGRSEGSSSEP